MAICYRKEFIDSGELEIGNETEKQKKIISRIALYLLWTCARKNQFTPSSKVFLCMKHVRCIKHFGLAKIPIRVVFLICFLPHSF
jgi:hypothetical protein